MNKNEAIAILDISHIELMEDRVEELIFEFKNYAFQNVWLPKLMDARINKLKLYRDAIASLGVIELKSEFSLIEKLPAVQFTSDSLINFFRAIELNTSNLKLLLSRSKSFSDLIIIYTYMRDFEINKVKQLQSILSLLSNDISNLPVRMNEWINTALIINELNTTEKLNLNFIELSTYLKKELLRMKLIESSLNR